MRLIDADALEASLHELFVQPNIKLFQVLNAVHNTSTIANDKELVHYGRWKYNIHSDGIEYWITVKCSECGADLRRDLSGGMLWSGYFIDVPKSMAKAKALEVARGLELPNYCQYCGAKNKLRDVDKDEEI